MRYAVNTPIELVAAGFTPGLVGVIGYRIEDGQGGIIRPRSTAGIVESPQTPSSSSYTATIPGGLPGAGLYTVLWDDGDETAATDQIHVVLPPEVSNLPPGAAGVGPCSLWTDADAIAACCDATGDADLDYAALVASTLLWELSGRAYPGRCRAVVRPQDTRTTCGPIGDWGRGWPHGCRLLSEVVLAGYPIREVEEVRIDGVALNQTAYQLMRGRSLIRLDGEWWPSCQYLERPTTEVGTWEVTYTYGADPPVVARHAAAKLGCQIARACAGEACTLPPNATQVIRQGVRIGFDTQTAQRLLGTLAGVAEVEAFLASTPRRRRRSAVLSPDTPPYPLVVSTGPADLEGS